MHSYRELKAKTNRIYLFKETVTDSQSETRYVKTQNTSTQKTKKTKNTDPTKKTPKNQGLSQVLENVGWCISFSQISPSISMLQHRYRLLYIYIFFFIESSSLQFLNHEIIIKTKIFLPQNKRPQPILALLFLSCWFLATKFGFAIFWLWSFQKLARRIKFDIYNVRFYQFLLITIHICCFRCSCQFDGNYHSWWVWL